MDLWAKLEQRKASLGKRGGGGAFLDVESDKPAIRVRLMTFEGPEGGELAIEIGGHYKLEALGATEGYKDKGEPKKRKLDIAECEAVSHAQHARPEIAGILARQAETRNYVMSDDELRIMNDTCKICVLSELLKRSEIGKERKLGYMTQPNRRYLVNVVHRDGQGDGAYRVLRLPKGVYEDLLETILNPSYRSRVLSADGPAHEFEISATGKMLDKEYKVVILPEAVPLGAPRGGLTNLLDEVWRRRVLRTWSLEDQQKIIDGGVVERVREDEDDESSAPPPPCFNHGLKNETNSQCVECTFKKRCDTGALVEDPEKPKAASVLAALRSAAGPAPAPPAPPVVPPVAVPSVAVPSPVVTAPAVAQPAPALVSATPPVKPVSSAGASLLDRLKQMKK